MRHGAFTILVPIMLLGAVGCSSVTAASPASSSSGDQRIRLAEGRDRAASQSAEDWVTHAEYVAIVTVVDEVRERPSDVEVQREEGLIGRRVILRVDRILWSSSKPLQPAPTTLEQEVAGWVFNNNNGDGEAVLAVADSPRLEMGHVYVRALDWVDDPCSSMASAGTWEGLGAGDAIPYDGVLGVGEFEGRVRTLEEATKESLAMPPRARGLREQVVGQPLDSLITQLSKAIPRKESAVPARECNPGDR